MQYAACERPTSAILCEVRRTACPVPTAVRIHSHTWAQWAQPGGHSSDLPLAAWVQSTGGLVHQDQARGAGLGRGWREGGEGGVTRDTAVQTFLLFPPLRSPHSTWAGDGGLGWLRQYLAVLEQAQAGQATAGHLPALVQAGRAGRCQVYWRIFILT